MTFALLWFAAVMALVYRESRLPVPAPRDSCPMCRSEHGDNLARLQKEYDARMARLLDKNGLSKAWGRA
jgi:hypothetical protein